MRITSVAFIGLVLLLVDRTIAQDLRPEDREFFESRIRPVLIEHCYKCHSADAQKVKGGLYVSSREALLQGGDTGPSLVPGKPDESLLLSALRYKNDALQ